MSPSWRIPRRTFLRGVGTAMALPWLESMAAARRGRKSPCRMAAICMPIGKVPEYWTPKEEGPGYTMPETLAPVAEFRKEFSVLTGLCHPRAWGAHQVETFCFLTGANILSGTPGYSWKNSISMDQVAAERVGAETRFPSLELVRNTGEGSGWQLAHNREGIALAPERDPRKAFERLFVDQSAGDQKKEADALRKSKSLLDLVREDFKRLESRVGKSDREVLDQYATSVREVERRLTRAEGWIGKPKAKVKDAPPEADVKRGTSEHMQAMSDVMTLAFQTDSTRIITYAVNQIGAVPDSGVTDGWHALSHNGGDPVRRKSLAQIDKFHVTQLAYFLKKLKNTPDGEGSTLLDNSMVLYGSGMGDASQHSLKNLPILLAGRAGGRLKQGAHWRYPALKTPLSNLFVVMLNLMGAPVESFADSTGPLERLV